MFQALHVADVGVQGVVAVGILPQADVLRDEAGAGARQPSRDPNRPDPRLELAVGGVRVTVGIGGKVDRLHGVADVVRILPDRRAPEAPLSHHRVEGVVPVAVVGHARWGQHLEVQVVDQQLSGGIGPGQGDAHLPLGGRDPEVVVDLQPGSVVDGALAGSHEVPDDEAQGRMLRRVGQSQGKVGPVGGGEDLGDDRPAVALPVVPDDPDGGELHRPGAVHEDVVAVQGQGPRGQSDALLAEVGGGHEQRLDQGAGDGGNPVGVDPGAGGVETLGEVVPDQGRLPRHGGGGERCPAVVLVQHRLHGPVLVVVGGAEGGHPVGEGSAARGGAIVAHAGDDGGRPEARDGGRALGGVVGDVLLPVEVAEHGLHVLIHGPHGRWSSWRWRAGRSGGGGKWAPSRRRAGRSAMLDSPSK